MARKKDFLLEDDEFERQPARANGKLPIDDTDRKSVV